MAVDPTIEYPDNAPPGPTPAMDAPTTETGERTSDHVTEARRNNVKKMLADVKAAKRHWAADFKRMRDDEYFAQGNHWPDAMPGLEDDRIIIDVTTRHIQLRMAALYAKNPTVVARRKETIDFKVWDEQPQTAVQAQATMQAVMGGVAGVAEAAMADPQLAGMLADAAALMDDIKQGMERRQAYDRLGRSLQLVFRHQIEQMMPTFKAQLKSMVVRALTTNLGWIKLDYQRTVGRKPSQEMRLADMRERMVELQRRLREWNDLAGSGGAGYDDTRAEFDELQNQINAAEAEPKVVLKEGLLFNFPSYQSIIPDKKCKSLRGFVGSDWVAEEMAMTCADIQATYNVDVSKQYARYRHQVDGQLVERVGNEDAESMCCAVYTIYNRRSGLVYVVCDGYDDFLKEPAAPEVKFPAFFPWFPLIFNWAESSKSPFAARSDVRIMMPMQREINRTQESLRQHRIASTPKYVHDASAFEEGEALEILNTPAHGSIGLKAISDGKKIEDMLKPIPKVDIDPNVYSADVLYQNLGRSVGSQEANLGQPNKTDRTTATAASISEASRLSTQESNADDLDDLLSLVAMNGGVVLLTSMREETAKRIAGPGSIWVTLDPEEAADQVYLEIVAGSSGRPNQAQEVAVYKEMAPLLMQIPGVSPVKLAEEGFTVMNSRRRPSDFMDPAITQSIISMNRGGGAPMGGQPANDPAQQGAEGAQNEPQDNASTENQGPGVQPLRAA